MSGSVSSENRPASEGSSGSSAGSEQAEDEEAERASSARIHMLSRLLGRQRQSMQPH